MVIHAMHKALQGADSTGIIGLVVDAKDEAASRYCRRFGFIPLSDDPYKLFMPPATFRRALHEPILLTGLIGSFGSAFHTHPGSQQGEGHSEQGGTDEQSDHAPSAMPKWAP
jgi:hypothetical protein